MIDIFLRNTLFLDFDNVKKFPGTTFDFNEIYYLFDEVFFIDMNDGCIYPAKITNTKFKEMEWYTLSLFKETIHDYIITSGGFYLCKEDLSANPLEREFIINFYMRNVETFLENESHKELFTKLGITMGIDVLPREETIYKIFQRGNLESSVMYDEIGFKKWVNVNF